MIQRTLLRQSRALTSCVKPFLRTSLLRLPLAPSHFAPLSQRLSSRRWYSSELDKQNETETAAPKEEEISEEQTEAGNPLLAELEKKDAEIIELKDRYMRSVAEFRNLQERTVRDIKTARDFAIQKFAKDLVDSVDNFDRALSNVPAEKISPQNQELQENEHIKDLVNLYEGLKMTEGILMSTLKKHGLERFDPSENGEKFDPNEHEATFMTPVAGKEDNTCFHTQSKGFKLNGRVLRAAKVGVVKNS